jgi:hypothetical protein
MHRVIVLYEQEPDSDAYEAHADVCRLVPGGEFRHGKVLGSPVGDPAFAYYAEWEFADEAAFDAATRSEEFMASGKDARDRGLPRPSVLFADVS